MSREENFMLQAVELARNGIRNREGGPFGCIVVKNDEVVGRGNNRVTSANDPTAHAEIMAIRDACRNLGTYQLQDCEIYSTCEPCPMCLGAIYWARPRVVYYAGSREDAAGFGFDDSMIYEEFGLDPERRRIPLKPLPGKEAFSLFEEWKDMEDKLLY